MKRVIKAVTSAGLVLLFAGAVFYCTVAGAPKETDSARRYMLAAGAFSLLLASFVCGCIHYILYLQRKLEEYKNKEDQKKDSSDS